MDSTLLWYELRTEFTVSLETQMPVLHHESLLPRGERGSGILVSSSRWHFRLFSSSHINRCSWGKNCMGFTFFVCVWCVIMKSFVGWFCHTVRNSNYNCWLFPGTSWSLCSILTLWKELQGKDKPFCIFLWNALSCCAASRPPERGTGIKTSSFAPPPDSPSLWFKVFTSKYHVKTY